MSSNKCPNHNTNEWRAMVSQLGEINAYKAWLSNNEELLSLEQLEGLKSKINDVNFNLKAVNILSSDKAKQIFNKGNNAKWSLDKILTELAIPKEQKQLILDLGKTNREEIITDLLANYSYTIEINTAKGKLQEQNQLFGNEYIYNGYRYERYGEDVFYKENINTGETIDITEGQYNNALFLIAKENNQQPTQYYSNLTVPGGTNYTENEIATPAITPSIKGHAQFATDNGIGWFRSDDKIDTKTGSKTITEYRIGTTEDVIAGLIEPEEVGKDVRIVKKSDLGTTESKTRRILEVQSDWGQKQRKSSEPDINVKYDIQQIINDLQKSGDLKIDCN